MSVRIAISVGLLVFFYPFVMEISKLEGPGIVKLYGVLGYFVLMIYLVVTGSNLKNTGRPFG